MTEFKVILGCKYANDHIDQRTGIFRFLDEKLPQLNKREPIPAIINSACHDRMTKVCTQDCNFAVYAIMSSGKISYHNPGVKL